MTIIYRANPPAGLDLDKIISNAVPIPRNPPWNGFNARIKPFIGKNYDHYTRRFLDADWNLYSGVIMQKAEIYIEILFRSIPWMDIELTESENVVAEPNKLRLNLRHRHKIYYIEEKGIYIFEDVNRLHPKEHLIILH